MNDNFSDKNLYAPPASKLVDEVIRRESPKALKVWLSILMLYPALDFGLPMMLLLATGNPISPRNIITAFSAATLVATTIMVWKVKGRILLLGFASLIFSLGLSGAITTISLIIAMALYIAHYLIGSSKTTGA